MTGMNFVRRQRGVGLPAALFLILVLALILAAMAGLQEGGSQSFSHQLLSGRALHAAESGAQIAVHRLLESPGGADCSVSPFLSHSFTSAAPGLQDCTVNVECRLVAANGQDHYTLTAVGRCGGGDEQASRVIEVRVRQ